ncbi:MAG: Fur family transcriptional regulator [Pseudomonadota bacterium]
MTPEPLIEQLKAAGFRPTRQRRWVCRVLDECTGHPDAPEIHRRIVANGHRHVSISAVYRILADLEKHEFVIRRNFGEQRARYEKASSLHHDHIIDKSSGEVREFQSRRLGDKVRAIAEAAGYELVDYDLKLYVVPDRKGDEQQ